MHVGKGRKGRKSRKIKGGNETIGQCVNDIREHCKYDYGSGKFMGSKIPLLVRDWNGVKDFKKSWPGMEECRKDLKTAGKIHKEGEPCDILFKKEITSNQAVNKYKYGLNRPHYFMIEAIPAATDVRENKYNPEGKPLKELFTRKVGTGGKRRKTRKSKKAKKSRKTRRR